ncbi:MAG TPA: XrtA/PEP-CTERM system histidine kinase PrsK [Candidatus Dormibacteraeota bacterium]|nr:XrtA/PEP-CTERM system histidine kinase PrsK [Candidatus Dormibacteraeota bacterium]
MDSLTILSYLAGILAVAIGLAAPLQSRRSLPHWALAAGMLVLGAETVLTALSADALLPEHMVYWQNLRVVADAFIPGTWLFFSLCFARGNYREFLSKWKLLQILALFVPVTVAFAFRTDLVSPAYREGPIARGPFALSFPAYFIMLALLLGAVVILMNFERTFRASIGMMRWRIKYVLVGVGLLFVIRAYTASQALLFHAFTFSLQFVDTLGLLAACLMLLLSLSRKGVFQVNVYPSQSILQGSLTVVLAGIYLLLVGALAKIVTAFGGNYAFTLKAFLVLVSLLVLSILFFSEKMRLLTRRFVSRHFQRPLYDYRTVWRRFTETTARCVQEDELCAATLRLVSEVFQALSVSIWLVTPSRQKLSFVVSTSLPKTGAAQAALDAAEMDQVVSGLANHPEPLDIDASREVWAILLRRLHPDEFRTGGNRICAPMFAGNELLGVVTLGDRVGGIVYSLQDLDLLKSVAEQAAANLLNIRLSQRLAQGKQMEAFQAMSTFFVHDLKNTASTLSLMLQNLPVHFNNPEFRQDALRGISSTVTHINGLIERLGLIRQEFTIRPGETDLNELVLETVNRTPLSPAHADGNHGSASLELSRALNPLPKLRIDRARIESVLTNLLLNARDASTPGGRVQIVTSRRDGWAVLEVVDHGCGMSADFIQHSLFRPFQTTKRNGLGIGMFQSRMIVEAHQGRIEVESELGKGTRFRVLLPLRTEHTEPLSAAAAKDNSASAVSAQKPSAPSKPEVAPAAT